MRFAGVSMLLLLLSTLEAQRFFQGDLPPEFQNFIEIEDDYQPYEMDMEMRPGASMEEPSEFMDQFSHALHAHSQSNPPKRSVTAEAALTDAMSYEENAVQLMRKGRYAEALQLYDKCLKIQLKALGDLHPLVAQTIDFMGVALLRLDRPYDALETFEKSLAIYQHLGGAGKRVDWALTVMHIGQALELQAENIPKKESQLQDNQIDKLTKEALAKYNLALEVFKVLEREDPDIDIANIMHCKGNTYNIRGQYREALRHFKYALGDKLQILGENDPSVGWTKNNIANSLKGLGQIDEAIKWYKEALETVSKHFGHDHPEVAHVHWNLALAYQTKGEMEAERRAAKGRRSFWFRLFFGKGRRRAHEGSDFLKMEKHLVHAFDVFQSRLGQDHTSTMRAKEALMALEELRRD